jgi:hypothetical protein
VIFGAFAASYYGVVNRILIAGVVVVSCGLIGVFARPLKNLIPSPEPQRSSEVGYSPSAQEDDKRQ